MDTCLRIIRSFCANINIIIDENNKLIHVYIYILFMYKTKCLVTSRGVVSKSLFNVEPYYLEQVDNIEYSGVNIKIIINNSHNSPRTKCRAPKRYRKLRQENSTRVNRRTRAITHGDEEKLLKHLKGKYCGKYARNLNGGYE